MMFGILKNWFQILQHNPHLTLKLQAHLPAALAAVHNVIQKYDPSEIEDHIKKLEEAEDTEFLIDESDLQGEEGTEGELAQGPLKQAEKQAADKRRDNIAEHMWIQYQQVLKERGEI
jgi:hypothetical protein